VSGNFSAQGRWIQGLVQGANNTVINIFHSGFESLKHILEPVLRGLVTDLAESHDIEGHYLVEQEKIRIEREKLSHQIHATQQAIELRQQEYQLRSWFFEEKIKLLQAHHASSIAIKEQEFQVNWDIHHLPLSLSRDEMCKLFWNGGFKFWILWSPITLHSDLPEFKSLDFEVEHNLGEVVKKYYSTTPIQYPLGFKKVFKRAIEDVEALHAKSILSPLPLLIFNTVLTDDKVYIRLTLPGATNHFGGDLPDNQISLPAWNWTEIKESLERNGNDEKSSKRSVKELIILLHVILTLYFADLYCFGIDPCHEPRLFRFLEEPEVPAVLQQWAKPYRDSLSELQEHFRQVRSQPPQPTSTFSTIPISDYSNFELSDLESWLPFVGILIFLIFGISFCGRRGAENNLVSQPVPQETGAIPAVPNGYQSPPSVSELYKYGKPGVIQTHDPRFNAARLRAAPNDKSPVVATLDNGTPVAVVRLNNTGTWVEVIAHNNRQGWVWNKYVESP
jgi:hypothetical protein